MRKILLFLLLILFLIIPIQSFAYTMYYDCGSCTVLTPSTNTSGLQALATANAANGWTYTVFGTSVQSRDIDGIVIQHAAYDQTVMIIAGVHGDDETVTTRAAFDLLNYLSANPTLYPRIRFIIIPMVNPDGRVAVTRWNANHVDLNRNNYNGWGQYGGCNTTGSSDPSSQFYKGTAANSEPETMAIRNAVDTYSPDIFIDWHMNSNQIGRYAADWKRTQINIDVAADGFSTFNDLLCTAEFGSADSYARSLGAESYFYEGGSGAMLLEVNRAISALISVISHRRYFNSHAIRATSSSATKIGDVTYSGGVLTSIPVTATSDSQSIEITGYKSPFVEATKTTINLANSISTPTFGQSTTTLTGVPLTISAASGSLDILVNSWGPNSKTWTESTTSAPTNPEHVIGGLTVGQSYRVSVSNALQSTITGADCSIVNGYNWCTADSSGNVTFTYGGSYSDHEFTIDQYSGGSSTTGIISGGVIY